MQIDERLFVYLWNDNRQNNCNTVVIDGKGPILIDPGHLFGTKLLFERMADDGIHPAEMKLVICTHAHPDHVEGVLAYGKTPAKIAICRAEEKFIGAVRRDAFQRLGTQLPEFSIDFYLAEGDLMVDGDRFQVFVTPGHSPGSICIYWPRYRILIVGDLLFDQSVGRSDLPGGDAEALKKSIDRMSKLPVEILVPGHGPIISGADAVRSNFNYVKKLVGIGR